MMVQGILVLISGGKSTSLQLSVEAAQGCSCRFPMGPAAENFWPTPEIPDSADPVCELWGPCTHRPKSSGKYMFQEPQERRNRRNASVRNY